MSTGSRTLVDVLLDAQRLGTLGALPIPEVIAHAQLFLPALEAVSGRILDMGTGAGVPGLVIAQARPDLELVLVDRREARIDAVRRGISALGWSARVSAIAADTEILGQQTEHHFAYAAVVCRGYGPPEETLRAARPFLSIGGILVVSEPPIREESRWIPETLQRLGYSKPQYLQGIVMFHVEH